MNKYALSFFLLLTAASVLAQKAPVKKSKVYLISSTSTELITGANGKKISKVRNGIFKQDYSTLRSDSALFYPDQNAFDAFGHVNINQGDTLNIFSDKLNYNGNTKVAILIDNVKMVDKDATLTTNYFTYNTATRIGTYTGGGKLVNKDNTLTSKNGYYFSYSRDAYFRYNVICNTSDAIIKTDTMRYNSGSRITYFYGPTNIYGKKDKDTLYTENGTYNTNTEQAIFGKKNLYKQGTKSLKGDSLFYDRLKGYGRATRNVTFDDNEQKITIKGDLGEYFKLDDRAIVTQHPYIVFVTEDKDTTRINDTNKKVSIPIKTDSLSKIAAKIQADSATIKRLGLAAAGKVKLPVTKGIDSLKKAGVKIISKADSLTKNSIAKAPEKGKRDSLFMVADTIATRVLTVKDLNILKQQRWLDNHRDTSIKKTKPFVAYTKAPKELSITPPPMPVDTSFFHREIFGKPKPPPVVVVKKPVPVKPAPPAPKLTAKDSLKIKLKADSLALIANGGLSDTSRIRIVSAYHHAKLFKSDLQAVADSMFYSSGDSTIRSYTHPMMWTQGSQLSGDTIHMQMKNKKLDNMDLFPSGLIVNIEKNDSLHFNQVGGKKIHGTFKDNKLKGVLVTGNAETIYYNRDTVTNVVKDLARSLSGIIKVNFINGELSYAAFIQSPVNRVIPMHKVKEEDKILKNFTWKPKDRPVSKESILPPPRKAVSAKPAPAKAPPKNTVKPGLKSTVPVKIARDTTALKFPKDTITTLLPGPPATVQPDTAGKKK